MRILMVCLGNICRSPLAEGILRKKAKEHFLELFIDSAGTSNFHIGENPDKRTIKNALKNGVDVSMLVARQFSRKDFDEFDIIYTMDNSNYSNVIALAKHEAHIKKVRLILNELYPNKNLSVPDPYFGGEEGFQHVFELLDEACEAIIKK
ncbi:MAG: low molecular weight protein-tyrosine-phosphatase, partial [Bacteroidia bacterium]